MLLLLYPSAQDLPSLSTQRVWYDKPAPDFGEGLDFQIQKTVKKQLVYEFALKLSVGAFTRSEFWIPGYITSRYEDVPKVIRRYSMNCNPFFQNN